MVSWVIIDIPNDSAVIIIVKNIIVVIKEESALLILSFLEIKRVGLFSISAKIKAKTNGKV